MLEILLLPVAGRADREEGVLPVTLTIPVEIPDPEDASGSVVLGSGYGYFGDAVEINTVALAEGVGTMPDEGSVGSRGTVVFTGK